VRLDEVDLAILLQVQDGSFNLIRRIGVDSNPPFTGRLTDWDREERLLDAER
jgi:hypothetical protein